MQESSINNNKKKIKKIGPIHPSLEVVGSTGVCVHGSGQNFPQFDSKASRPIQVASNFEWPFLRKMAKLWLLSSFLN